jgi:two-component system response regulator PilR (NtrC family)
MARLLVVDDKDSIRTMLDMRLTAEGHAVEQAENVATADRALSGGDFDVVITDLRMGKGGDGLDVLRKVKERQAQTEVIVMTAFGSDEVRERALELGALCYLEKSPRLASEVVPLVKRALEKRDLALRGKSLAEDNQLLRERLEARARLGEMVGRSAPMQSVFELVDKVAAARTTVLITGESGVGKELVARAVHARSPRAQEPFVPVNCGAIPEGLIESELFGHVRGAFTGAQTDKAGLFQTAEGGTLFLDEIAELPTPLQVKLLRAIQDRRIRQVGGTDDVEVDVRIVAATNRDLPAEVRAGRFREDLYYRLNVVQIRVPPLRERREDILLLADHFLRRFGAEHRRPDVRLSREARRRLDEYGFPGNVRELENLIERAVALSNGEEVTVDALPAPLRGTSSLPTDGPLPENFSLEAHLAGIERELIDRALAEARGIKKDAAARLGLTFRQFRHRLKKLSGEDNGADPEGDDQDAT